MAAQTKYSETDFVELKDTSFYYAGKPIKEQRLVSNDLKVFIKFDNGYNYATIYTANENGKGSRVTLKNNNLIFSIGELLERFNNEALTLENTFEVLPHNFKRKSQIIEQKEINKF